MEIERILPGVSAMDGKHERQIVKTPARAKAKLRLRSHLCGRWGTGIENPSQWGGKTWTQESIRDE